VKCSHFCRISPCLVQPHHVQTTIWLKKLIRLIDQLKTVNLLTSYPSYLLWYPHISLIHAMQAITQTDFFHGPPNQSTSRNASQINGDGNLRSANTQPCLTIEDVLTQNYSTTVYSDCDTSSAAIVEPGLPQESTYEVMSTTNLSTSTSTALPFSDPEYSDWLDSLNLEENEIVPERLIAIMKGKREIKDLEEDEVELTRVIKTHLPAHVFNFPTGKGMWHMCEYLRPDAHEVRDAIVDVFKTPEDFTRSRVHKVAYVSQGIITTQFTLFQRIPKRSTERKTCSSSSLRHDITQKLFSMVLEDETPLSATDSIEAPADDFWDRVFDGK
ncbi:hypothetical protein DL93DRAFT_2222459, partial [Clavulina sp. PMI_390]